MSFYKEIFCECRPYQCDCDVEDIADDFAKELGFLFNE